MGYYILGIIIFLLLIVFISDLVRQARDSEQTDDFDTDEFFDRLSSQYPGTFAYREEFSEEYIDKEFVSDDKTSDNNYQNLAQSDEDQDKDLQDVLPEDYNKQ